MEKLINALKNFAHHPDDTRDMAFQKFLILLIAASCSLLGSIWSLMYYFIFGFGLTMMLPFCFTLIVGSSIFISHSIKDHRPVLYAQLTCITWISALIQWSIGSMDGAGVVIVWCFLGPLGALIFLGVRKSLLWMGMFLAIIIISAVINPTLSGDPLVVSTQHRTLFHLMNLSISSIVVFGAAAWFVNTIQVEKGKSENLLQKIQTLFGQHVSTEVADRLIKKDLGKEEQNSYQATIMFLDIRNFTKFANAHSPAEVVKFQNIVFSEMINIVRKHKGMVNQLLGDGVLAIFGAPIANTTHVRDAISAGFDMIDAVNHLAAQGQIHPIKIGIGVHTGQIIAGEVGNEYRKLYSVSGSAVIIASRIEQLNKKFNSEFLVSDAICKQMNHEYECVEHGKIELKGISEPVGVYQLK